MAEACSHQWVDPTEPPIQRAPYSPAIGTLRREMKQSTRYVCNNCGESLQVRAVAQPGNEGEK